MTTTTETTTTTTETATLKATEKKLFTSFVQGFAVTKEGSLDVEATVAKFAAALAAHRSEAETDSEAIRAAIDRVFSQHSKVGVFRILKPTLAMSAAMFLVAQSDMDSNPGLLADVQQKVLQYIDDNTQGGLVEKLNEETEKVEKVVERPNSYLIMSRGHGGGVSRRADEEALKQKKEADKKRKVG